MNICFKEVKTDELHASILQNFNRYQCVENAWHPDGQGGYYLIPQRYVAHWDDSRKKELIDKWRIALEFGGMSFCAYDEDNLVGFSCVDGRKLGSEKQYLELLYLHVSYEYRGKGIGKKLFTLCAEAALELQCKKLYLVANSAEETQKVYHKLGCVYAKELIPHLFEQAPDDVHLEYVL